MSTSPDTVAFIEDQLSELNIRSRPMFGEYGLYCDEKIVALICDDDVFLKPSSIDPTLLEGTELAPPYPGAKNYHRVPGDALEDREWFGTVVQATADALPLPKPRPPKTHTPRTLKPKPTAQDS